MPTPLWLQTALVPRTCQKLIPSLIRPLQLKPEATCMDRSYTIQQDSVNWCAKNAMAPPSTIFAPSEFEDGDNSSGLSWSATYCHISHPTWPADGSLPTVRQSKLFPYVWVWCKDKVLFSDTKVPQHSQLRAMPISSCQVILCTWRLGLMASQHHCMDSW